MGKRQQTADESRKVERTDAAPDTNGAKRIQREAKMWATND